MKIYILTADNPYEQGGQLIRAYRSKDEAEAQRDKAQAHQSRKPENEYHSKQSKEDADRWFKADEAWEKSHPEPDHHHYEWFNVVEVDLVDSLKLSIQTNQPKQ